MMIRPEFIVGQEWVILIVVLVILLFGAKKIPEIARSIGRARAEFEKGKKEAEKELSGSAAEREKLEKLASDLGIEIEGKSVDELKEEIKKALDSAASK